MFLVVKWRAVKHKPNKLIFNLWVVGEETRQYFSRSDPKFTEACGCCFVVFHGLFCSLLVSLYVSWFIILLRFHTKMEWMCDISFRRIKIIRELFQSHLGQSIIKWGYKFSVLLNVASMQPFWEEAVELDFQLTVHFQDFAATDEKSVYPRRRRSLLDITGCVDLDELHETNIFQGISSIRC